MKQTIGALSSPALATTSDISIALCTYNGAAYLPEQWQSLLQQERLPDEVIICDDGSTDNTRPLLRQLAADAPFRVEVIENPVRLGFNKNFGQALSRCTGDLVFLCDQDDFWMPQKLRLMAKFMQQNPAVQVAFNDADIADESLQPTNERFWTRVYFDAAMQQRWLAGRAMDVLLDGNRVMGCATVIRQPLLTTLLPIPDDVPGYIYDGWLSLLGAGLGTISFVNEPLQLYRTHPTQQVGVHEKPPGPRVRLRDRFIRDRTLKLAPLRGQRQQLAGIRQLLLSRGVPVDTPGMNQLAQRLAHYSLRSELPDNRLGRVGPVLTALREGDYHRYANVAADWYSPYLAALGDLLE